jgi:hypothetical protein
MMKNLLLISVTVAVISIVGNPETYQISYFGLSSEVTVICIYSVLCLLWALNLNESVRLLNLGKIGDVLTKLGNLALSPLFISFLKLYHSLGESYSLRNGLISIRRIYTEEEIKSELLQVYGFGPYIQEYPVAEKLALVGNSREKFLCLFDKDYNVYLAKSKCSAPEVELSSKNYFSETLSFVSDFYGSHPYIVWGIGASICLVGVSLWTYKMGFFDIGKDSTNTNTNMDIEIEDIKVASTIAELAEEVKHLRTQQAFSLGFSSSIRNQILENTNNILAVKLRNLQLQKDLVPIMEIFGAKIFTFDEIAFAKEIVQTLTPQTSPVLIKLLNQLVLIEKNSKWPDFGTAETTMYDGLKKHWSRVD